MNLEEQVSSLELSKVLKALGVKQESQFYWALPYEAEEAGYHLYHSTRGSIGFANPPFSAFTVAELGEMLPASIPIKNLISSAWLWVGKMDGWEVSYTVGDARAEIRFEADTEADARAKMLIHLINCGIVKP